MISTRPQMAEFPLNLANPPSDVVAPSIGVFPQADGTPARTQGIPSLTSSKTAKTLSAYHEKVLSHSQTSESRQLFSEEKIGQFMKNLTEKSEEKKLKSQRQLKKELLNKG